MPKRVVILITALLLGLASCGAPPEPALGTGSPDDLRSTAGPRPPGEAGACPRLDPELHELAGLADPAARAAELGVTIEAGRAFVALLLRDEAPASFAGYGAEITTQVGSSAQGFVPLDQLCALSSDPAVVAVRIPIMLRP